MEIVSLKNPQLQDILALREHRARKRSGRFLIEGYRELSRAMEAGVVCERIYICPELFLGENEELLLHRAKQAGAKIILCAQAPYRKISYRDRPDGLLAVAVQSRRKLGELPTTSDPLFVIAEGIEKPGNLGTILRSCDATNVTAVVVAEGKTDLFNPNVVRASVGTLFTIPVIEAGLEETLVEFKRRQVKIIAATPHASVLYTDADLRGPIAIAFGTEQLGLSETLLASAPLHVRIPMCGVADSLNVAMSTTVLLYEAYRQRCTHAM